MRRTTPEEFDRWAENVITGARLRRGDSETLINKKIGDYMEFENSGQKSIFNNVVKSKIYKKLGNLKAFNKDKDLFRSAGGKNLERDRMTTAKIVTKDVSEYKRVGANKIDLDGFDTKNEKVLKRYLRGKIKNKSVEIYKTSVIVKGKDVVRYRDKKGRFAKLRK